MCRKLDPLNYIQEAYTSKAAKSLSWATATEKRATAIHSWSPCVRRTLHSKWNGKSPKSRWLVCGSRSSGSREGAGAGWGSDPARAQGDDGVRDLGHILEVEPGWWANVWNRDMAKSKMTSIYSPEYHKVPKAHFWWAWKCALYIKTGWKPFL